MARSLFTGPTIRLWLAALLVAATVPAVGQRRGLDPGPATTGEPFIGALLIDARGSSYRDPIRLARLVEEIRATPFHYIAIQVVSYGDAFYQSELLPRALGVSESFDPLGELIAALREDPGPGEFVRNSPLDAGESVREVSRARRTRKIFAWIDPFRVANARRAIPLAESHISLRHSDWLSRDSDFRTQDAAGDQYLEPGLVQVEEFVTAVVGELAANYEIDGIIFDGLRYPGFDSDWGYHPTLIETWRRRTGKATQPAPHEPIWQQLRRQYMSKSLAAMAGAAKSARPGLMTAAFGVVAGKAPVKSEDFAGTFVFGGALQDWPGWMREDLVDQVWLRNFQAEAIAADSFDAWNEFAAQVVHSTGTEALAVVAGSENISLDVLTQIRRARLAGLFGAAVDNYREPVLDATSRGQFFRTLGATELARSAERLAFGARTVAAIATPTPTPRPQTFPPPRPALPTRESQTLIDLPAAEPLEAPPPPESMPPKKQDLEAMLGKVETMLSGHGTGAIRPSDEALERLRARFPNTFGRARRAGDR